MKQEDLQSLLELRNILIRNYQKLDSKGQPTTAVMLQRDTAKMIEESMKTLDGVLSRHVEIKSKQ